MKWSKVNLFIILGIIVLILLPRERVLASSSDIYENYVKRNTTVDHREKINRLSEGVNLNLDNISEVDDKVWAVFWETYIVIKSILPIIVGVSWILGAIFILCIRKSKKVKRSCIIIFGIVIPMLGIMYVFGIPSMQNIFNIV